MDADRMLDLIREYGNARERDGEAYADWQSGIEHEEDDYDEDESSRLWQQILLMVKGAEACPKK